MNKHVGSILHTSPEDLSRAAKTVNEKTRLGIPLIIGDDCIHGYSFWPGATIFPSQLGMAVSWDPDKVKAAGRATAEEVSCTGVHWTFSPVLCIARDTRWGRVDETFGEDPMLIGELASAMVKGYQGGAKAGEALPKNAILACAKHFAGYSETQGGRDASEADLSHRKLESWFLPPFERVAKEGCGTFMLGYESIEGVPVTFNKWLLTDKLRGAWQYNGTLITDWDNVGRSVWEQHVKPDYVHAAADAVKAGNDLVMTTPQFYEGAIEAVKTGLLDESLIDDAVARILALKFRLGLFEDPRLPDAERIKAVIGSAEHQQTNLELARESVALLRNDGALPFAENTAKRIAVVGPLADDAQNQLGDWTGNSGQVSWMPDGQPRDMIATVLDGLIQLAADDCEVVYSRGANVIDLVPDPAGEFYPDGQPRPKIGVSAAVDQALIDEAVANARQSDLIVAVVGDVVQLVGETCSTATLELLGGQNALLDALAAVSRETGKPMVTVLISSKPQVLPASIVGESSVFAKRVNDPETGTGSILWAPNPGMRGGQAIAETHLWPDQPVGPTADHLPTPRGPAAGLLQPDSRPARRPVRRPHPGSGVRVRRRPELHDVRIRRTDHYGRRKQRRRHIRRNRHRTCRNHPHQHRRARRRGDHAGLHRRHRDLLQLDRPRIEGVPARRTGTRRDQDRHLRDPGGELHDRGPGRQPHRRARRIRTAHRPLLAP